MIALLLSEGSYKKKIRDVIGIKNYLFTFEDDS